jgi:hypothetical protein
MPPPDCGIERQCGNAATVGERDELLEVAPIVAGTLWSESLALKKEWDEFGKGLRLMLLVRRHCDLFRVVMLKERLWRQAPCSASGDARPLGCMPPRVRSVNVTPRYEAIWQEGELDALVKELRAALPRSYKVQYVPPPPQRGYGLTGWDIVEIWTTVEPWVRGVAGEAAKAALKKIYAAAVRWGKRRMRRKDASRSTYQIILDAHGEVWKAIVVDKDGKVTDNTDEEVKTRAMIRRSIDEAKKRKERGQRDS